MEVKKYQVHRTSQTRIDAAADEFQFSPEVLREKVARANRLLDEFEREERAIRESTLAGIETKLAATGVARTAPDQKGRHGTREMLLKQKVMLLEERRRREAGS